MSPLTLKPVKEELEKKHSIKPIDAPFLSANIGCILSLFQLLSSSASSSCSKSFTEHYGLLNNFPISSSVFASYTFMSTSILDNPNPFFQEHCLYHCSSKPLKYLICPENFSFQDRILFMNHSSSKLRFHYSLNMICN